MTDTSDTSRLQDEREHLYRRIAELELRHQRDTAAIVEHQRISNEQLETIRELTRQAETHKADIRELSLLREEHGHTIQSLIEERKLAYSILNGAQQKAPG